MLSKHGPCQSLAEIWPNKSLQENLVVGMWYWKLNTKAIVLCQPLTYSQYNINFFFTDLQLAALLGKTLLEKNGELEAKLRKLQEFAEDTLATNQVTKIISCMYTTQC